MVKMGNGHNSIDSLIMLNDLQQLAVPSTTAVSSSIPSREDFQQNRTNNLANLVGSIGPAPDMLGGLSEEELLEIVMSASPVGASISGGKVAKSTMQQLQDIVARYGMKPIPGKPGAVYGRFHGQRLDNSNRLIEVAEKKLINWNNKTKAARMKNKQVLDKYGIDDPDKQGMVDPITALLNYFSKN